MFFFFFVLLVWFCGVFCFCSFGLFSCFVLVMFAVFVFVLLLLLVFSQGALIYIHIEYDKPISFAKSF